MAETILNTIIILCMALFLPGIINRTRALLSGRKGPRLTQHIDNAAVLLKKGTVYSPTAGPLFKAAPALYLASSLLALLFVPVAHLQPVLSFEGDVVMFAYLLGLGRAVLILAAMQTGSSFEGMGASREALYGALVEPALFITLATLALITGHTSFAEIFSECGRFDASMAIITAIMAYTLYKILNVEAGRIPVDDPRTHLELTMIHEVMVLDYSGPDLGMIQIAGWMKTAAIATVAGNVMAYDLCYSPIAAILFTCAVAVCVGITESLQARARLVRNTTYILSITAVAAVIFFVAFLLLGNFPSK